MRLIDRLKTRAHFAWVRAIQLVSEQRGSFEIPGYKMTLPSDPNGSGVGQYIFVKHNSSGFGVPTSAATDEAVGVHQGNVTSANAGRTLEIMVTGISKVKAGGSVAVNDKVTADSSGRAVTASTGNVYYGIAREASTGANQIIAVLLVTPTRVVAP